MEMCHVSQASLKPKPHAFQAQSRRQACLKSTQAALSQQLQFVAPGTVHAFPIVVASKLVENQDSKARSWGVNQPANLVPRPNSEQQAVDQRPKRQLPLFQKTFDLFWLPKWDIGE
ncbi:hypothetical protein MUK42_10425 [Musa troglodytarum]|uniref:Uncharacterized protein n=1 Tax=Musa troglodytarum TaxID=320322 RepID=A0A9E7GJM5_9LILI|nr:hypothetical protein MUK42_10425 [Musa troglodytarum]